MSTDRIEKKILLHAPLKLVWRALSDHEEFAAWFGIKFDGPFKPGARLRGTIVGTSVDGDIAKAQKQHAAIPAEITVERVDPERLLSFRWHPHALQENTDYSKEPTTLVAFTLEKTAEGVLLTVTESDFDRIPLARRAKAFEANEQGWAIVIKLIEKYLAKTA